MSSDTEPTRLSVDSLTKIALGLSVVLMGARLWIADSVGFGDAEALYVSYASWGQATYLDHPGLVGWLGSLVVGPSGVLAPTEVHRITSIAATMIPWLCGLTARAAGASWRGVLISIIALLVVPEVAIGMFAFTPDLPLAVFWLGALGLAALALRSEPRSSRALAATLGAGLCTGLACASKATGALLALALFVTWLDKTARDRFRTVAPYSAVLVGALCVWPMLRREASLGWPMLHHRFVNTQIGFGASLRNLGALIGGQLLYLTPVVALVVVLLALDLAKRSREDPVDRLLLLATIIPLGALSALTLLSRVAEPHWLAPAYLGLVVHLARRCDAPVPVVSRKIMIAAATTALAAIAIVFAVVRYPVLPAVMGRHYDPKLDLVNDLYVWRPASGLVARSLDRLEQAGIDDVSIVGPHWIVCAQVQAALGPSARIGCETPEGDDFQWLHPRSRWEHDRVILYVTDDRFPVDLAERFPNFTVQGVDRMGIRRAGRIVRTVRVLQLGRAGTG